MKNYDAYSPKIFEVTGQEIDKLSTHPSFSLFTYDRDLDLLRKSFFSDIETFSVKEIPLNLKRGTWDSARLLVFKRASGQWYAKRHNNSQWLLIGE